MANTRQKSASTVTALMAFGQSVLVAALSGAASFFRLDDISDHRLMVHATMGFAVVPLLTGLGLLLHVRFCRHVDQACPWIGFAWIVLSLNLAALILFVFQAI